MYASNMRTIMYVFCTILCVFQSLIALHIGIEMFCMVLNSVRGNKPNIFIWSDEPDNANYSRYPTNARATITSFLSV